jgi:hypothetical protein
MNTTNGDQPADSKTEASVNEANNNPNPPYLHELRLLGQKRL